MKYIKRRKLHHKFFDRTVNQLLFLNKDKNMDKSIRVLSLGKMKYATYLCVRFLLVIYIFKNLKLNKGLNEYILVYEVTYIHFMHVLQRKCWFIVIFGG